MWRTWFNWHGEQYVFEQSELEAFKSRLLSCWCWLTIKNPSSHFSSFSLICNIKNRQVSVQSRHQDVWYVKKIVDFHKYKLRYFPLGKPRKWSLWEVQHGNWRERGAVRRPVMVGRGKKVQVSPCFVLWEWKQKPVTRMCVLGNNHYKNQKAVSVIASGMGRKFKWMNILKWGELFSKLPNLKLFDGLQDAWEN